MLPGYCLERVDFKYRGLRSCYKPQVLDMGFRQGSDKGGKVERLPNYSGKSANACTSMLTIIL